MFKCSARLILAAVILGLGMARSSMAVPTIYADPELSVVDLGEIFEIRVMANADAETISSFDIVFQFDAETIKFLPPAIEGALFLNPPNPDWYTWFQAGEEESTGTWEVFDVMLPGDSYVLAPGELCRLEFRAVAEGYTEIAFAQAWLTDRQRQYINPLVTVGARVCVGDLSSIDDRGGQRDGTRLGSPYPNPACEVVYIPLVFEPKHFAGPASAAIYDAVGRLVTVTRCSSPVAPACLIWDGRDSSGRRAGPGTYFVRPCTSGEKATRKITLVR